MNSKKVKLSRCAILISALSLGEYAIEHLLYLLVDAAISGGVGITADTLSALGVIFGYLTQSIEIFALSASGVLVLLAYVTSGRGRAAACAGVAVASRLIYLIPHYYMSFMSSGYDSLEALSALVPMCLFISAIYYAEISLGVILGALPAWLRARKGGGSFGELIASDLESRAALDLGNTSTAAISIITLTATLMPLVSAVINAVTLLVERGGSVTPLMLAEIVFDLLFVILAFTITHLILSAIKARLISSDDAGQAHQNTKSADTDTEETV